MDFSRRDGAMDVKITEQDLDEPAEVYSVFKELILDRGERRITVDLSEVRTLTSLMIGTLVSLHLLAYENVVVLTFEGMHERVRTLLGMIGVDKLVEAHYPGKPRGA